MDLRSHYPYWLLCHGIIRSYPSLEKNTSADIAIIGGGISGALTAWYLQDAGFNVLVVDRRHIAMGSTAASTALLQYEIDVPLRELIHKVGEKNAIESYLLCRQAINDIEWLSRHIKAEHIFNRKPSFQFASFKKDAAPLYQEYLLRKKIGIKLQWLEQDDIQEKFGFIKSGGLLSADGAEMDAYLFTHVLLENGIRSGLRVFDRTTIMDIQHSNRGVELLTDAGLKIKARKLVVACGYESQRYIPLKVQQLSSTYAIVSDPFQQSSFWYKNALIWETNSPYIYLRTTSDNRILMGGKDIPYSDPDYRDSFLPAKTKALERSFGKLFPSLLFKTDFSWAGTFASTKDGLPYIGSIRQMPHTFFALGFGGNGITFSIIAAQLIRDSMLGKKKKVMDVFSFER